MRITYNVTGPDRKALVKAVADCLGEHAVYLGTPTCAFRAGSFTITREGALEFDDSLDRTVVESVYRAIEAAGFTAAESLNDIFGTETAGTDQEEETTPAEEDTMQEENPAGLAEDARPQEEATAVEPDSLTISLPMTGHTGTSLRNLIFMIFSRGTLLSKATGGTFSCAEELVEALRNDACILTVERLLKTVEETKARHEGALIGLDFEEDRVSFTGFPFTETLDRIRAFQQLAFQMTRLAKEQKRALAREADTSNERYAFRIWLLRLGMMGDEYKTTRKVLLSPLSGSAAFKDADMENRWKEKQTARRDAARAAQEESTQTQQAPGAPEKEEAETDDVSA